MEFFDSALDLSSRCGVVFTVMGDAEILVRVSAFVRCRRLSFFTATAFPDFAMVFESVRAAYCGAKLVQLAKATASNGKVKPSHEIRLRRKSTTSFFSKLLNTY